MKIKLLSLLLLLVCSSVTWAATNVVHPLPFVYEPIVTACSNLKQKPTQLRPQGNLPKDMEALDADELLCEYYLHVDIVYMGGTFEVTFTVLGDCDLGIEELKDKVDNVRNLVSIR